MKNFLLILLSLFFICSTVTAQNVNQLYQKALKALQVKDTTSAIIFFQESIIQNKDAASYYELSKIYWKDFSFLSRNKAYEFAKWAVLKDEKNIEYKYYYAELCLSFSRFEALERWKQIVEIDSSQIQAWINLAEFSGNVFAEWDKSIRQFIIKDPVSPLLPPIIINMPLQGKAVNDFVEASNYYQHALKIDSTNYNLCLSLGLFYAKNNLPMLGIKHLKRLERLNLADKNVYQCLGLLNYKANKLKESHEAYYEALSLMPEKEWEDFALNSLKFILETSNDKIKELDETELRNFVYDYWKTNDPLLLTDYNERLLEHYSRVAYANLCFSIPRMNIAGWKSNRGEMVLRYGEPISRIRIRPTAMGGMGNGPDVDNKGMGKDQLMSFGMKEEIWSYSDFTIRFEDPWLNGNFQFPKEQLIYINDLRKTKPTTFYPKFDGPIFDLPYQTYQFVSNNKTQTDVYLSYEINYSDTATTKEKFADGYDVGVFMFDGNFNKKQQIRKTINDVNTSNDFVVNSILITSSPVNGNLAFEMIRKKDKGVTAYHGKYSVKDYSGNELKISDIVLAIKVEIGEEINGGIKRNDISILPNPTKSFSKNDEFFLYYEAYNLTKNMNNTTDFEQKITIQKKEESGVLSSVLSVVGLDKKGEKVSLTSRYQTQEKDPQMYLQLDMSKYEEGEYVITVTIKDLVNGKEISNSTTIIWN